MAKLSDSQKTDLKIIFDSYDTDRDGQITHEELKKAFKRMNLPMSDIQIANIIGKVDKDGNNTIDFDEFCARNAVVASKQLFEKYDKDANGYLGPNEVVLIAKDLGYGDLSVDQAKLLIAVVDADNDGRISYDEFKSLTIAI